MRLRRFLTTEPIIYPFLYDTTIALKIRIRYINRVTGTRFIHWTKFDGVRNIPKSINTDIRGSFARFDVDKGTLNEGSMWSIGTSLNQKSETFRGIHFQEEPYAQSKVVWVSLGKLIDVMVDLRSDSSTFLNWSLVELSSESPALFLPRGFGHAYLTLTKLTLVNYAFDKPFVPSSARRINILDPYLQIKLPRRISRISQSDKKAPFLSSYFNWP